MNKFKQGDLVRITEANALGTPFVSTQILRVTKILPPEVQAGEMQERYKVEYHSGFPVRKYHTDYILWKRYMKEARTGKNQHTNKTTQERNNMEETFTLTELQELGIIQEGTLEGILVTEVKDLIGKSGNSMLIQAASGINELGVPVNSISDFKKVKGVINTLAELVG